MCIKRFQMSQKNSTTIKSDWEFMVQRSRRLQNKTKIKNNETARAREASFWRKMKLKVSRVRMHLTR